MKNYILISFLFISSILFSQQNENLSNEAFSLLKSKARSFFYSNKDSCVFYIHKIEN